MNEYMMNEYSFECNVFDESGADASEYIKFFPEWCYNGEKPELRLVLLIKHWNKYFMKNGYDSKAEPSDDLELARYSSVAISHYAGAVDFSAKDNERRAGCNTREYNRYGGKWVLPFTPEQFSGTGKVIFKSDKTPECAIYYTINFFKKYVLGYTYKTSGEKSVTFTFDHAPKTDICLKLMEASNRVPCLTNSDITGETAVLKAGSKIAEFNNIVVADKRFRVTFDDKADSQFYLLRDDTGGKIGERMADEKKRVLRCPFCLRPVTVTKNSAKLQRSGYAVSCAGEQIEGVSREVKSRGRVSCNHDSPSLATEGASADEYIHTKLRRYKPLLDGSSTGVFQSDRKLLNKIFLPQNYECGDSIITTVIGGANVGKSVFISRLAGIASDNDEHKVESVSGSPIYMSSALNGFFDGAAYYTPETWDEDKRSRSADAWRRIFNTVDSSDSEHGRMVDYAMPLYGEIAKRTSKNEIDILQRMPFIVKLDNDSNMTFFDVPGELLHVENAKSGQVPSIKFSDGLILLVNVDSSAAHSGSHTQNSDNIKQAGKLLEIIVNSLGVSKSDSHDGTTQNDITDHALAVVLCKLDMFDDKFDVNSAVLASDLCDGKGKYKGSRLQINTDAASDEVERIIADTPGSGELFNHVNRFKYRKYFAVSSLGVSDCVEKENSKARLLYTASPKRFEHVLQWLLWQSGIIE
ncbi:MAG: hypothetical protein K2O04_03635 [Clostridiales bacterium]|nr:hypothetical protein [Clostridiales bacterium]